MREPTIGYFTNAADDAYPTSMQLAPDERVRLEVMSNALDPLVHAIGVFETRVGVGEASALRSAVRDPAFTAHRNPSDLFPGTIVRRVDVTRSDGSHIERIAAETTPSSAAFLRAETAALAIVDAARRCPLHALAMRASVSLGAAPMYLVGEIVLHNPSPTRIEIPAARDWEASGVELTLRVRRNDVPLDRMSNDDQVFVTVTAADLRGDADARLVVEPHVDRQLAFSVDAPRPAGNYGAVLGFELVLLDDAGQPVLRGELTTPELPLRR